MISQNCVGRDAVDEEAKSISKQPRAHKHVGAVRALVSRSSGIHISTLKIWFADVI